MVIDVGRVDAIDERCIDVLLLGYGWALHGGHGYEVIEAHGTILEMLQAARLCSRPTDDEVLYPPVWFDAAEFLPNVRDTLTR